VPAQTAPTRMAAQANAGSFKTPTSKPIAEPHQVAERASADSSATATYRPCVALKPAGAAANVALFATAICKRPAEPRLAETQTIKHAYPQNACHPVDEAAMEDAAHAPHAQSKASR
ncbi:MAG: hypothetical protein RLZZ433_616, partial [Pseudomonadota bacterium]